MHMFCQSSTEGTKSHDEPVKDVVLRLCGLTTRPRTIACVHRLITAEVAPHNTGLSFFHKRAGCTLRELCRRIASSQHVHNHSKHWRTKLRISIHAFFHVRLKLVTIVIQDDSPLFPGMGFTKQPFSALIS